MADKELKIKVITEADTNDLDNAETKLQEIETQANATGDALRTAFEEAEEEVTALEQELDQAVLDGDNIKAEEVAQELSDARGRAEELEEQLSNLDSTGLTTASENARELEEELNNTSSSTGDLSNSMGLIEGTMMLDLANQAGQLGANAEGMAESMDTASISVGQLATQTGVAEPQMRSLISYISNATFPQEEAMLYVKSLDQMQVSANNLGESATNIDKINDAFHLGAQTTNSMVVELGVLGVDLNNVSSSFNALAYANANTAGGMQNFYSFLRKFDSQFHELGFNVDQTSVIIAAATQKWGGGKAALSGLSSALKESNGDVRALEQSLGLESGTLDHATELTGEYEGQLQNLADEEMEHKTLTQQLGAIWEDLSLQLSPILSPLMSFIGIIGQFGQIALAVNSIITLCETFGILQLTEGSLIPVQLAEGAAGWFSIGWIVIAIALGIALGLALVYLYNHSERFRNAVNWLGQRLMWLANTIMSSVQGAINWFTNALQAIPNAIQSCLDWASSLIMNHPIVQAIKWLGDNLAYIFSAIGLGQRSPGKIYKAMKLELDSSEELVEDSKLPSMFARLGGSISDNFSPDVNKIDTSNFSNNIIADGLKESTNTDKSVVNNIFNIDYLAKKEFVDEIIDIIQKEINWDNKTAGRTV